MGNPGSQISKLRNRFAVMKLQTGHTSIYNYGVMYIIRIAGRGMVDIAEIFIE